VISNMLPTFGGNYFVVASPSYLQTVSGVVLSTCPPDSNYGHGAFGPATAVERPRQSRKGRGRACFARLPVLVAPRRDDRPLGRERRARTHWYAGRPLR